MSLYLRTPWIARAVRGKGTRPTNPAVQVVAIGRTTDTDSQSQDGGNDGDGDGDGGVSTRELVLAKLSDREVWVYAVFTPAAVCTFEDDGDMGRPITEIRGGLVNLTR